MTPGDEYHRRQARYIWLFVGLFVACVAAASLLGWVATILRTGR